MDDARRVFDIGQQVDLQVRRERVRKPHVAGEGRENEVSHLNTVRRDHISEYVVMITQKLWKVVQKNQQNSKSSLKVHSM